MYMYMYNYCNNKLDYTCTCCDCRSEHLISSNYRISPSTFNKVTSSMQDYLTIPGQRLANLSQQCHHRAVTKRLVDDVHQKYGLESVQGYRVLEGIATLEQRKQLEFSVNMDTLGLKRIDLAHSLTHTLTHIEKHAGVFLIKPVFSTKLGSRAYNLITPTSRPLPITKPYSRPHTGTTHKSPSTPHPNMQLVNRLIQSRQQQTGVCAEISIPIVGHLVCCICIPIVTVE